MSGPTITPPATWPALTANERALLLAYRAMDDRGQLVTLAKAAWQAEQYPRRAAPSLRLVARGGE